MKKPLLLVIIALSVLVSCQKDDLPQGTPSCIENQIDVFKSSDGNCEGAKVSSYDFLGERVYVFQDGICIADGGARVLDSECMQICFLGGFAGSTTCEGVDFASNASNQVVLWKH